MTPKTSHNLGGIKYKVSNQIQNIPLLSLSLQCKRSIVLPKSVWLWGISKLLPWVHAERKREGGIKTKIQREKKKAERKKKNAERQRWHKFS